MAISEKHKVCVNVYFVPEGHITRPLTVTTGHVATPGNVFLLVGRGFDNGYCEALLPAEGTEMLGIFDNALPERFDLHYSRIRLFCIV
jgi:hypothetical protein